MFPKQRGIVSPQELNESEDEELIYPSMHQPEPSQDLNNPVAQPVPDNVPELRIPIAESAHQEATPLRRSTLNR